MTLNLKPCPRESILLLARLQLEQRYSNMQPQVHCDGARDWVVSPCLSGSCFQHARTRHRDIVCKRSRYRCHRVVSGV